MTIYNTRIMKLQSVRRDVRCCCVVRSTSKIIFLHYKEREKLM